ncbi:MAG: competence/damage-inducible protein A [Candidatus Omnitrophota bacterium]
MKAEIIAIGTELLLGHVVNTNTSFLARGLASLGIDLFCQTTVGDNKKRLREALTLASNRADIIITSGGLGPTLDDITCETLARFAKRELIPNKSIQKTIRSHFRSRKLKTPTESLRQALIPAGARWVRNGVGTAVGLILERRNTLIIALPGPPHELEPMFDKAISPYLRKYFSSSWTIRSRYINTTGLVESQIHRKIKDLLNIGPNPTVGIYAKPGQVELKISAKAAGPKKADRLIASVERIAKRRLKDYIFGYDGDTLESVVGDLLTKKKKTIATAESCTGGLLSNRITNISGSSGYFLLGVVSYSKSAKMKLLGVRGKTLKDFGAVSGNVAREMARGIRSLAASDIGIGITGIAGPKGGTKKKPVGLVCISFSSGKKTVTKEFIFKGTRAEIKNRSCQAALDMIRRLA